MHFSALFALMAIIGAQSVFFGTFCRAYSAHLGLEPPSKMSRWVLEDFRLERGLVASLLFFFTGLGFDLWVLIDWLHNNMGETNLMRQALFALTLMVLGSGGIFASFFLTFLSMKLHAPRANDRQV